MKPTKKVNTQLASQRAFYCEGGMIRPYPPLFKIYQCYAQILNASQLPTHFQHDLNLVSTTKLTQAELFATDIVKLLYYSYKIRKKLEITHRLNRSTILYAYV